MHNGPATWVASLVGAPGEKIVDLSLIARARAALPSSEAAVLSQGRAVDLHFADINPAPHWNAALREALSGLAVDILVQPDGGRRKRLFLADMDSTMIGQECIDELADMAGIKAHVAAITARSMNGEIAFEPALRERVALLKGLPLSVIDRVLAERITLASGGRALVATMRAKGGYAALVSGGFTVFTGPVAAMIGFDENIANVLHET
ncbi:MAG TPA: HAD-IB family phosphatase, partial [Rhabdaerophilum sp.]|nr:HAD-IB family phosphatase [Rhabdaerophilum sp.]